MTWQVRAALEAQRVLAAVAVASWVCAIALLASSPASAGAGQLCAAIAALLLTVLCINACDWLTRKVLDRPRKEG